MREIGSASRVTGLRGRPVRWLCGQGAAVHSIRHRRTGGFGHVLGMVPLGGYRSPAWDPDCGTCSLDSSSRSPMAVRLVKVNSDQCQIPAI